MVNVLRESNFEYLSGKATFFRNGAILLLIVGSIIIFAVPYVGFLLGLAILALAIAYWKKYIDYGAGIRGEELVSQTLKGLDGTYHLLEDVKLPSMQGNIDQVLVGPNGIFAVEAKNYSGRVSCHEDRWYHEKSSRMQQKKIRSISIQIKKTAANLNGILTESLGSQFRNGLFVEPVVVFTNENMELETKEPTVSVTTLNNLVDIIGRHRAEYHYSSKESAIIANTILSLCEEE